MERALITSYGDSTQDNDSLRCRYATSSLSLLIKRIFDIVLSLLGIVLLSPLFACIFIQIRRREKGAPAIFSQKRVGRGGKEFTLYKFRSMRPDAEADGQARLSGAGDDRMTPFGQFLRSHHLDELPQLWNVLRGDMSFVGYRPERRVFIDRIMQLNPDYELLFKTRPGLFSNATLYNGYTDTMKKMLRRLDMDLSYLRSRNLFTDIRIIALTGWFIVSGKKF